MDGRAGMADEEAGVDVGLASRHAPLHALEESLARALERLRPAVQQAAEEERCHGSPIACIPFLRAAGRARLLYTGAVSLLHFMESDFIRIRLCTHHAAGLRAACDAITAAADDIASRVLAKTAAAHAAPAISAAEAAVASLLAEVAADPLTRPGSSGSSARDEADGAALGPGGVTAADVESLGHVCFAIADALRQLKLIVSDLDVHGRAKMAALEVEAAAVAATAAALGSIQENGAERKIGGRRVSTLM